ncbi:MAG: LysR family transcriptional regulator [Cardiobacteriaceae bacterium]|nr:LysR family transcriptional regulator [Cardiobacteriaceae bacterium]
MLERHHLAVIRAVVEYGTLTRAAESLFLSQSALSHTVRKLEDALGTPLWQKEGRELRLTQAGHFLHQLSLTILPQFEHAEEQLRHYAGGRLGILRIGMECHPCYQWLLNVVAPYLAAWPRVDVDVKQQFQFKGIAALYNYEVDILITPDPVFAEGLVFTAVFDYEQVLVVHEAHPLARREAVYPEDLTQDILITYPVPVERLDIFQRFLLPAQRQVAEHKTIETTEILLQMVAAERGVTALPRWLIEQQAGHLPLRCVRLGEGLFKQIFLGVREADSGLDYIRGFIELAGKTK